VEGLRSIAFRLALAGSALREDEEGQALVEYALLLSLNRHRLDHDPDGARPERLGDLQQRQQRALSNGRVWGTQR